MSKISTLKALGILGLPINFSQEDLRRTYRRLALANHPDHKKPEEQEDAHRHMAEINAANEHLVKVLRGITVEQVEAQTALSTFTTNPKRNMHSRSRSSSSGVYLFSGTNPVQLNAATFNITSGIVSSLLMKVSTIGRELCDYTSLVDWYSTLHEEIKNLNFCAREASSEWSSLHEIQRAGEWKKNCHLAADTLGRLRLLHTTCRSLDRWADTAAKELQDRIDEWEWEFASEPDDVFGHETT